MNKRPKPRLVEDTLPSPADLDTRAFLIRVRKTNHILLERLHQEMALISRQLKKIATTELRIERAFPDLEVPPEEHEKIDLADYFTPEEMALLEKWIGKEVEDVATSN